jgi:hypothetical protein
VPLHNEAGTNLQLAERVKSILASKQLTLHQASQRSAALFGRGSPYYLPHNLYYDLSHGHFSPSLFQLVAFSRISSYRLRDWLRVFGFDIEAIPRLQIQLRSKRTALLESSMDDPDSFVRWFQSVPTGSSPTDIVPLAHLLEWTEPRRLASLSRFNDRGFLYAQIGSEDDLAFPELLPGSIVRVNPKLTSEALRQVTAEGSEQLFLIQHDRGMNCARVRVPGRGRIGTISNQLPYARMEFRMPDEARILGVVDLEIRNLVAPRQPSVAKSLAKRWSADLLPANQSQLGPLLRQARIETGLSFREAAAKSRGLADAMGDERYFTASGSLSDYETLNTPPRHFHKVITFCVIYSLALNHIFHVLGLNLEDVGREPITDLLTGSSPSGTVASDEAERNGQTGFISQLAGELGGVPLFLRSSLSVLCGLPRLSLKDFFWIGGSANTVHPFLKGATLAVVNRQRKKPNDCASKPLWQQSLSIVLKRDGSYVCGCCSQENDSLVIHTNWGGIQRRVEIRSRDAEMIGRIVAVARNV